MTSEADEGRVLGLLERWIAAVRTGETAKVSALYADDAVLHGTVSPMLRDSDEDINRYFRIFLRLPHLDATHSDDHVRIIGDVAIASGYYTFFHEKDEVMQSIPARYTFVWQKQDDGTWKIIEHHSSALPA